MNTSANSTTLVRPEQKFNGITHEDTFDGKIVNRLADDLEGWHTVTSHSLLRRAALTRTKSAPIKFPSRKPKKRVLAKTVSNNPNSVSNRIMYDRDALLSYRFSPQSMTPPTDLADILEATKPAGRRSRKKKLEKTLSVLSDETTTSFTSDSDSRITSDPEDKPGDCDEQFCVT